MCIRKSKKLSWLKSILICLIAQAISATSLASFCRDVFATDSTKTSHVINSGVGRVDVSSSKFIDLLNQGVLSKGRSTMGNSLIEVGKVARRSNEFTDIDLYFLINYLPRASGKDFGIIENAPDSILDPFIAARIKRVVHDIKLKGKSSSKVERAKRIKRLREKRIKKESKAVQNSEQDNSKLQSRTQKEVVEPSQITASEVVTKKEAYDHFNEAVYKVTGSKLEYEKVAPGDVVLLYWVFSNIKSIKNPEIFLKNFSHLIKILEINFKQSMVGEHREAIIATFRAIYMSKIEEFITKKDQVVVFIPSIEKPIMVNKSQINPKLIETLKTIRVQKKGTYDSFLDYIESQKVITDIDLYIISSLMPRDIGWMYKLGENSSENSHPQLTLAAINKSAPRQWKSEEIPAEVVVLSRALEKLGKIHYPEYFPVIYRTTFRIFLLKHFLGTKKEFFTDMIAYFESVIYEKSDLYGVNTELFDPVIISEVIRHTDEMRTEMGRKKRPSYLRSLQEHDDTLIIGGAFALGFIIGG